MIEVTETQVKSDIFDFLRIIDDDILRLSDPDEIASGANFNQRGIHPLDSVIHPETEFKEKV